MPTRLLIESKLHHWVKPAPSCKMSDRGTDYHDISEGPMHEVKLHQGSPCGPRSASTTPGHEAWFVLAEVWDGRPV
jgi:hypothetical protein